MKRNKYLENIRKEITPEIRDKVVKEVNLKLMSKTIIDEDGSNLPTELYDLFSTVDENADPYKEMERLRGEALTLGYDFDYDLSGTPTEFWKIN
jgi:hypothetical protein